MWDKLRNRQSGTAPEHAQIETHLRAFQAHWEACRKSGDVPNRADIDPLRIEALRANAFIAERIAPGVIRLRVAGMHLNELMGIEVRGMPLCSFITPGDRDAFALRLVDLFDGPAILRLGLNSRGAMGRPALSGTLLMLPLRSDLGDVSRALGCLVTRGPIGQPARRFAITSAETRPLTSMRPSTPFCVIRGDGAVPCPANSGRAHLRLVE